MGDRDSLPFSGACERNKDPILEVLKHYLTSGSVLELGHGTAQHADYFSKSLPVTWYPSDVASNIWMARKRLGIEPLCLEVNPFTSLKGQTGKTFDHVFTANTLHIMPESEAYRFCEQIGDLMNSKGFLLIYGPFKWKGEFTSQSNEQFDRTLRSKDPNMGIREFHELKERLERHGVNFQKSYDLPANNHILVFQKE